jgi:ABC-type nitrate/sulfonate/bicarbonate transport system permease component
MMDTEQTLFFVFISPFIALALAIAIGFGVFIWQTLRSLFK